MVFQGHLHDSKRALKRRVSKGPLIFQNFPEFSDVLWTSTMSSWLLLVNLFVYFMAQQYFRQANKLLILHIIIILSRTLNMYIYNDRIQSTNRCIHICIHITCGTNILHLNWWIINVTGLLKHIKASLDLESINFKICIAKIFIN